MAVGASPEVAAQPLRLQPLELMLDVVNDASLPLDVRLNAARWAAPYVHHHKGQVDQAGRDVPITIQVIRFAEPGSLDRLADKTIDHDPSPTAH